MTRAVMGSQKIETLYFTLRFSRVPSEKNKKHNFAIVVSKKVSPLAVSRNSLKRRMREILREHGAVFAPGSFAIFYLKPASLKVSFKKLKASIIFILGRAKIEKLI